jgi:hypothetical protein
MPDLAASRKHLIVRAATWALGTAMVVAAFFHNEYRAQNWDPQQTRVYVERTLRFGGTFFENGMLNKGPLEPFTYRVAALITTWDGFWYAISAFVLVASGIVAWAASRTVRALGGHRHLGTAVSFMVFFHFALGKAEYAGVLYSRNMVVALLGGAWIIALNDQRWTPERSRRSVLFVGVLLGLSMQTLFVSTIAAASIGVLAWNNIARSADDAPVRRQRHKALVATALAVFVSAPLYYLLRGRIAEFWGGWWTYAKYQNTGTGRSLGNQLVYGREVIMRYYRTWPISFVIVVSFVLITAALWRSQSARTRVIHLCIGLWFLGAWTELVMSQRYSGHYFSILAIPTSLMAAAVIAQVYRLLHREHGDFRTSVAWPLAAGLLAIGIGGGEHFNSGLQAASAFTSVSTVAAERRAVEPGHQRSVRAVLDMVSNQNDPLLAWTEYPWAYLNYHRVSATRWIWKSFMMGQIYLGRTDPKYILPNTWKWFADDMREAHPNAFLEETALLMTPGTPFAAYVGENFSVAYRSKDHNIYLRKELADELLHARGSVAVDPQATLPGSLWTVTPTGVRREADAAPSVDDVVQLAASRCTMISGSFELLSQNAASFLSFRFEDPVGSAERVRLNISELAAFAGNDAQVFDTVEIPGLAAGTHSFSIVIGDRSAVLVIDGQIGAAVRLSTQTALFLETRAGGVAITDLQRGRAPTESGC